MWTVVCSIIPMSMYVGCQVERGFSLLATGQEQHMLFIPHRNASLFQIITYFLAPCEAGPSSHVFSNIIWFLSARCMKGRRGNRSILHSKFTQHAINNTENS